MSLAELAASRIVFDGVQRQLEQLGRRTQEQLLRFQEPARAWLEATASDPRAGLEGDNDISLLRMQMSMQQRYPQIGSLVYGYPDGSYQQNMALRTARDRAWAKSLPEARFAQQIIRVDEREKRVEEWVFYDQQMTAIASERRPWGNRYDPRNRPWYEGASDLNLGTFQATDPFVLQLPAEFGMALSRPLSGPKGGVAAVTFTVAGAGPGLGVVPGRPVAPPAGDRQACEPRVFERPLVCRAAAADGRGFTGRHTHPFGGGCGGPALCRRGDAHGRRLQPQGLCGAGV
jgi:hypothetical protein